MHSDPLQAQTSTCDGRLFLLAIETYSICSIQTSEDSGLKNLPFRRIRWRTRRICCGSTLTVVQNGQRAFQPADGLCAVFES